MKRVGLMSLMVLLVSLPVVAQRGGGAGGARGGGFSGPGGGRAGGGFNGGGPGGSGRISAGPVGGYGGGLVGNPYGNLGPTPFSNGTYGAGFGSVVFPGGVRSFGSVGSPIYSSRPVVGGYNSGFIGGGVARTAVYPVPVFVGGYYGTGAGYQDPQQVTIINQQPPAVIINQAYEPEPPARPVMRVYGNGADTSVNTIQVPSPSYPEGRPLSAAVDLGNDQANPTDEPTVYLIALKDGSIYASYAFWAERDTLHYITPGHAHNQVSLDQVDMAMSKRLNRERKLDFNLR
jgi:hypothetical protein